MSQFEDAIKYALVITVDNYAQLRAQNYPGFFDIEETKLDRQQHLTNLPHLGFDNIIDLNNPTRDQVDEKVLELRKTVLNNAQHGRRSFIYAYYGGAGCATSSPG